MRHITIYVTYTTYAVYATSKTHTICVAYTIYATSTTYTIYVTYTIAIHHTHAIPSIHPPIHPCVLPLPHYSTGTRSSCPLNGRREYRARPPDVARAGLAPRPALCRVICRVSPNHLLDRDPSPGSWGDNGWLVNEWGCLLADISPQDIRPMRHIRSM